MNTTKSVTLTKIR